MRDLLVPTGGRVLGQEEVAAELHVSVRTVPRMLQEEGTTFRAIVEQTREHLAEELLVTAGLSVEQVADGSATRMLRPSSVPSGGEGRQPRPLEGARTRARSGRA